MIKHQIEPFIAHLIEEKERKLIGFLSKWKMFPARNSIKIQKYDGDWINSEGVQFGGSIRTVYWNFFQPFIKNYIVEIIKQTGQHCLEKGMDIHKAKKLSVDMLDIFVSNFYNKIIETDLKLMGVVVKNKNNIYTQHKEDLKSLKIFIKNQADCHFYCNWFRSSIKIAWDIVKWVIPSGLIGALIYKYFIKGQ